MKSKRIIALDPGTVVTGFAIITNENGTFQALDFGCIRPPKNLKLSDRYLIIFEAVEELLKRHDPGTLVVETQYVQHNVQSAIKLGMARGVVILAAKRNNIPVFQYTPTQAKKAVTGSGRASKYQVQGMVTKLLCLAAPPTPEDAADAIALALCHAHSMHFSQNYKNEV